MLLEPVTREDWSNQLFKNLSLEVKKKPVFEIYGSKYKTKDGTCIRDYIHVSDISEIHYKILMKINKYNTSTIEVVMEREFLLKML